MMSQIDLTKLERDWVETVALGALAAFGAFTSLSILILVTIFKFSFVPVSWSQFQFV